MLPCFVRRYLVRFTETNRDKGWSLDAQSETDKRVLGWLDLILQEKGSLEISTTTRTGGSLEGAGKVTNATLVMLKHRRK